MNLFEKYKIIKGASLGVVYEIDGCDFSRRHNMNLLVRKNDKFKKSNNETTKYRTCDYKGERYV